MSGSGAHADEIYSFRCRQACGARCGPLWRRARLGQAHPGHQQRCIEAKSRYIARLAAVSRAMAKALVGVAVASRATPRASSRSRPSSTAAWTGHYGIGLGRGSRHRKAEVRKKSMRGHVTHRPLVPLYCVLLKQHPFACSCAHYTSSSHCLVSRSQMTPRRAVLASGWRRYTIVTVLALMIKA